MLGGDADARVRHTEQQRVPLWPRRDTNRAVVSELDGVAQQIPQYLAHAGAVGRQVPYPLDDVQLQQHALLLSQRRSCGHQFRGHAAHVERLIDQFQPPSLNL